MLAWEKAQKSSDRRIQRPCPPVAPLPFRRRAMCTPASSILRYSTPLIMLTPLRSEFRPMHPAGGAPQRAAEGRRRALQHGDLECCMGLFHAFRGKSARNRSVLGNAPMPVECSGFQRRAARALEQIQRDIEADAAGADDDDVLPGLRAAGEQIHVAGHAAVVDAGNRRLARLDAGRQDHFVELRQFRLAWRRGSAARSRRRAAAARRSRPPIRRTPACREFSWRG